MKKNKPTTGLKLKVLLNYIATGKLIERQAAKVAELIAYRDKEGVIFGDVGSMDNIREVTVTDVRIDREHVYRDGKSIPNVEDIVRFHVRVRTDDNTTEGAWIDAYLLGYDGDALRDEVTAYLARITEPKKKARRDREIRYMRELMKKYPEEAAAGDADL